MIRLSTHVLGAADDLVADRYDVEGEIARTLVLPGFGRTADEYFHLSAILLDSGVSVIVPDVRCHPGRSAGSIRDFRLSGQVEDVRALLDRFDVDAVMATSLSFPPALRVLADRGWDRRLVGIVPVVSPADTLKVVTGFDCHTAGGEYDLERTLDVDGFETGMGLVADADGTRMMWDRDVLVDARRYRGTLTMVVGARDDWVDVDQARALAAAIPGGQLSVQDDVGHDFGRSLRRVRQMFQAAADTLLRSYGREGARRPPIDLVIRARQELKEAGVTDRLGPDRVSVAVVPVGAEAR